MRRVAATIIIICHMSKTTWQNFKRKFRLTYRAFFALFRLTRIIPGINTRNPLWERFTLEKSYKRRKKNKNLPLQTKIFNKSDRLAFRHQGLLILRYWSGISRVLCQNSEHNFPELSILVRECTKPFGKMYFGMTLRPPCLTNRVLPF